MTPEQAEQLLSPFPAETIGKLPRIVCPACSKSPTKNCSEHGKVKCPDCNNYITTRHIHLDYVGHAAVTKRLLDVDSEWTWEPVAVEPNGAPALANGGLWIRLTIGGTSRLGWGDGPDIKQMILDAIRNAAMRFGVALDLWSKDDIRADEHGDTHDAPGGESSQGAPVATPAPKERIDLIREQVVAADLTEWVKDQGFSWPWTPVACAAIEQRVRDVHIERFAASPNVPAEAPPVPADASPVRDGRMLPSYATVPTEPVELPPCAEDAAEPAIVRGPATEPGPGQAAGNASAGVLTEVEIAAEVRGMPVEAVRRALNGAGLSIDGTTSELRKRLVAFRTSEEPF